MPNNKDFYGSSNLGSNQRHYSGGSGNGGSNNDHRKSSTNSSTSRGKTEWRKTAYRICGEWSEQFSSKGKIYYYNCRTEVSQWMRPPEWTLGDPPPHELAAAMRSSGIVPSGGGAGGGGGSSSGNAGNAGGASGAAKRPSSTNGGRSSPNGAKRMKFGSSSSGSHYNQHHRLSSSQSGHASESRGGYYHSSSGSSMQRPSSQASAGSTIASVMRGVTAPTFYHHSLQQPSQQQQQQRHTSNQQQQSQMQPASQSKENETSRRLKSLVSRVDPSSNDDMDISPDSSPCTSNDEDADRPRSRHRDSSSEPSASDPKVDKIVAALRERLNAILTSTQHTPVDGLSMAELLRKLITAATSTSAPQGPVKSVLESLEHMLESGAFGEPMSSTNLATFLQKGLDSLRASEPLGASSVASPRRDANHEHPSSRLGRNPANSCNSSVTSSGSTPAATGAAPDAKEESETKGPVSLAQQAAEDLLPPAPPSPICPSLDEITVRQYVFPEVLERCQQMTQLAKANYHATKEAWLVSAPASVCVDRAACRVELQADKLSEQMDRLQSLLYCELCAELKNLRSLVKLSSLKVELTQQKRETLGALIEAFEKRPNVIK